MGTKSLSSNDVKQLVGLDECVCLPLSDNSQGQVGVCVHTLHFLIICYICSHVVIV